MPDKSHPSADEANKEALDGLQRSLRVDEESLRSMEAARRTSRAKAEGGLSARLKTILGFMNLRRVYEGEADTSRDDKEFERNQAARWFVMWTAIALVVLAVGAYFLARRGSDPTVALRDAPRQSAASAAGGAAAPAGGAAGSLSSGSTATKPVRYLMVADADKISIVLEGGGQSGTAVWLGNPGPKGSYAWDGDNLDVKLVWVHKQDALSFDQHFELKAVKQSDGTLKGTWYAEEWRYSPTEGLERLGMAEIPATAKPE